MPEGMGSQVDPSDLELLLAKGLLRLSGMLHEWFRRVLLYSPELFLQKNDV